MSRVQDLSELEERISEAERVPFSVLSSKSVYSRYVRVTERDIEYQDGRVVSYDVVGKGCDFNIVFPFHKQTRTVTLIYEYCQGPNRMMFSLPGGGYSPDKHESLLHSAEMELSEEAALEGGEWHQLTEDGLSFVKSTVDKCYPFLCIDPREDAQPHVQDEEEHIWVVKHVPVPELKRIIRQGKMMSVATTC